MIHSQILLPNDLTISVSVSKDSTDIPKNVTIGHVQIIRKCGHLMKGYN